MNKQQSGIVDERSFVQDMSKSLRFRVGIVFAKEFPFDARSVVIASLRLACEEQKTTGAPSPLHGVTTKWDRPTQIVELLNFHSDATQVLEHVSAAAKNARCTLVDCAFIVEPLERSAKQYRLRTVCEFICKQNFPWFGAAAACGLTAILSYCYPSAVTQAAPVLALLGAFAPLAMLVSRRYAKHFLQEYKERSRDAFNALHNICRLSDSMYMVAFPTTLPVDATQRYHAMCFTATQRVILNRGAAACTDEMLKKQSRFTEFASRSEALLSDDAVSQFAKWWIKNDYVSCLSECHWAMEQHDRGGYNWIEKRAWRKQDGLWSNYLTPEFTFARNEYVQLDVLRELEAMRALELEKEIELDDPENSSPIIYAVTVHNHMESLQGICKCGCCEFKY